MRALSFERPKPIDEPWCPVQRAHVPSWDDVVRPEPNPVHYRHPSPNRAHAPNRCVIETAERGDGARIARGWVPPMVGTPRPTPRAAILVTRLGNRIPYPTRADAVAAMKRGDRIEGEDRSCAG